MSKSKNSQLETALENIEKSFRNRIIDVYDKVKNSYSKALYSLDYDATGLNAGKFCETVLRFLQKNLTGSSIPFGTHIPNFATEISKISNLPKTAGNESLRIIIPRCLLFIYTMRGKRGIGHVGGDIEANQIDTETIVRSCDWIICELIRIFHNLSLEEAQAIVNSIAEKHLPQVWEVAGKKRILIEGLTFAEKTLLLLYQSTDDFLLVEDLFSWTDYSNLSTYKRSVLTPMHKKNLIEFDQENQVVYISPIGIKLIEDSILNK